MFESGVSIRSGKFNGQLPYFSGLRAIPKTFPETAEIISINTIYKIINETNNLVKDYIKRMKNSQSIIDSREIKNIHTVPINSLGIDNYTIKKTLFISVEERNNDEFIACFYDADLFGYGESIPEAIEDLKNIIILQYEFLLKEIERGYKLGPIPSKQLKTLEEFLSKE